MKIYRSVRKVNGERARTGQRAPDTVGIHKKKQTRRPGPMKRKEKNSKSSWTNNTQGNRDKEANKEYK